MLQKPFFILLSALLVAGLNLGQTESSAKSLNRSVGEDTRIVVQPRGEYSSTAPRMPSATRIEVYYDEELFIVGIGLINRNVVSLSLKWFFYVFH